MCAGDVASHVAVCEFYPTECRHKGCHVVLPRVACVEHEEAECQHRRVLCRYHGCEKRIRPHAVDRHASTCEWRPVRCPLGCGVEVPVQDAAAHRESECPLRVAPCTYCGEEMAVRDIVDHTKNDCREREKIRAARTLCMRDQMRAISARMAGENV